MGRRLSLAPSLYATRDFVVLFFVVRTAAAPERAWMRQLPEPEVEDHVVTEAEVTAVAGTRRDRRHFLHGFDGGRRAGHHVLAAVDDPAHAIAKDHTHGTNTAAFARSEVARMRAVR